MVESPDFTIRYTAFRSSACTARCAGHRRDDGHFRRPARRPPGSGCRIYTFITTLRYVLEAAAHRKAVWVLDRPNPAGRPVEGLTLRAGWESFVGAGPMPMRHGLTLGELGYWFIKTLKLDVEYRAIEMQGWQPDAAPGFGWPLGERIWINPSPNAANLWMARAYAGTVMVEGTTLSEGRGTTRALELFGAPDIDAAPSSKKWRPCSTMARWLPPTRMLVRAHVPQARRQALSWDPNSYRGPRLRPREVQALAYPGAGLQSDPRIDPDYPLWRDFVYEYEHGNRPSTLSMAARYCANGSTMRSDAGDLDALAVPDEQGWVRDREGLLRHERLRSPDERSEVRDMLGAWSGIDATALKLASSSSR